MIDTVIFDLDGTLLDTLEDLTDSVNYMLRHNNMPERSIDEIRSFIGNGVPTLIRKSVTADTDNEQIEKCIKEMRAYYKEHSRVKTGPYDGIQELLQELKANNIKTAVVTNKLEAVAQDLCSDIFGDVFTCVIGDNGINKRKPAPDNVFRTMKILNSVNDSTLYVGDSDVDMITAKNAGLKSVGVTWGFRDCDTLMESGAKYIINTPSELMNIIKNINES